MTMEEPDEELEPLFDYSRVQPINIFIEDDDDVVPLSFLSGGKRKRNPDLDLKDGVEDGHRKVVIVVDNNHANGKENKEEDWMPLPPCLVPSSKVGAKDDSILQEISLTKQELASFAQNPEDVLKAVLESAKRELCNSAKPVVVLDAEQPHKPERQKILISIQDKEGQKAFRMYMDDKLDRLFKMYADKVQLNLESLVFCFDGEKLSPTATPATVGLENDDIIEVHTKSR